MFWYFYGVVVTAAHIPLVIDALRFAFPQWKLSRIGNWSRYMLMVTMLVIFMIALWQCLCVFLPLHVSLYSATGCAHVVFTLWFWLNSVINYLRALLTHPGVDKTENEHKSFEYTGDGVSQVSSDIRNRAVEQSNLDTGRASSTHHVTEPTDGMQWNPDRGNYCKICCCRVAYLDHHCPYTGNCFGLRNYSYFYLSILYGLMGGLYALVLTAPYFWKCDVKPFLAYLVSIFDTEVPDVCEQLGTQSRAFIPVVCGMWLVGMMFLSQNILLLADISTFNILKNSTRVPILRFIGQRIKGKKFRHPNSRLNILVLRQRAHWFEIMATAGSWFVYVTIFLVALVQVPIAIDLLRFFFPRWKISRAAGKVIHLVLFVCMGTIFSIGISYHLFIYLPLIVPSPLNSFIGWLHLIFALWLWTNMLGNYYHVVSIHPGKKEKRADRSNDDSGLHSQKDVHSVKESPTSTTEDIYLRERQSSSESSGSEFEKEATKPIHGLDWHPKDTHYCTICECSIPRIDHHCPFTGCCAGLHNYSNFFIGLVYGSVGLLYAIVLTAPYFFDCNIRLIFWFFGLVKDRASSPICAELEPHSQIFIPVFSGFFVTTVLLTFQILCLLSDLSTYNVLINWGKYPMLKFMWQRMRGGKCLDPDSRLNTLILSQRPNLWWYLLPVRNTSLVDHYKTKSS